MKTKTSHFIQIMLLALLVVIVPFNFSGNNIVHAGGPLVVGGGASGGFGPDGQPFVYPTATPIPYRTDGGFLGQLDPAAIDPADTPDGIVGGMFQVWEDVPTSNIAFNRAGGISSVGVFTDGDVSTALEYNAVVGDCNAGIQSPIIYDADGGLFASLGMPPGVIGFAGPCVLNSGGAIESSIAALNGNFFDGDTADGVELSLNEFQAAFIHEFGHFFGLDHSQINLNCLSSSCTGTDDAFGLPTMFPLLISSLVEDPVGNPGVHPARTLSADDIAWVSHLYPGPTFSSTFGGIDGKVLFSDGITGVQGGNVIARQADDAGTATINESRRNAVSSFSGFQFTGNPGNLQASNGGSIFGSTSSTLKGAYVIPGLSPNSYHLDVSSIKPTFTGGSSVGSLSPTIDLPAPAEYFGHTSGSGDSSSDSTCTADPCVPGDAAFADAESIAVSAGSTVTGKDIILNGTPPRFDALDTASRNETFSTGSPIGDGTHSLSLSPFNGAGDLDFLAFSATAGSTVNAEIFSRRAPLSTPMDSVLEFWDSSGTRVNTCRDIGMVLFDDPCININPANKQREL